MTVAVRGADGAPSAGRSAATVRVVAGDDAAALALFAHQQAELAERYGEPDTGTFDPADLLAAVVVHDGAADAEPVACVALRDVSATDDGRGGLHPARTGEVKRLYVAREHRGRGHARAAMDALHAHAAASGLERLVLETGTRQPESVDLYLDLGYAPTEPYGHYAGTPLTRCFALELPGDDTAPTSAPTSGPVTAPVAAPGARAVVEVRATTWDDPVAAGLRREMHETSSVVLYPELLPGFEAAGGFDAVDARLGEGVVASLVAWRADEPVGCAFLREVPGAVRDVHGEALEVKKVFVRDHARRSGVARALMAAAEHEARGAGAATLLLETGRRQPQAVALYRSLGFRVVLPYPPYDDDPLGIGLCFAKPLT
ncbi:GNAT family N-acetyltransferase [Cellulosimicrobium marinum]|uniref:GNAT family N-acetyltransferase n=1 Tax=Cellulosimicrobium marinum TaxID=1638992 RepID=UPI001E48AF60|nr:GNAT family N-acetyltransferase [Cellulosimicrobium marinum]MCB7135141.1 GNAT family N-acetyltransferase [Cellulosimicrobium marinum]